MASKIRVLDEHTINKIAAGEVIESPASVIKELVENSLDAGATDIYVEIQAGGRQLIRVTDNGCGMGKDDAVLCLERHATSKIRKVEDIESIDSMGFRGEAIPSIASISKFTLITCPQEESIGTLLKVDGGKMIQCGEAVRSPGTTIEVKSLFFNVPVRRKFQKSPAYDANEIAKILTILALGHPHVKFHLIDNQKTVIQTGSLSQSDFEMQLKDRLEALMGSEFVNNCCAVNVSKEGYHLQGYVGLPILARQNRTGQYLFINKRAVFSPLISFVAKEAYGTILPTNKHPVFVLHLSIPGDSVDVNVHPQKKEVRLRQDNILRELILKGVQQALQKPNFEHNPVFAPFPETDEKTFSYPTINPAFPLEVRETKDWQSEYKAPEILQRLVSEKPSVVPMLFEKRPFPKILNTIPRFIILDAATLETWKAVPSDSLCLVDQKAAHARVIYENLKSQVGPVAIQTLLIPHSLKLAPPEANALRLVLDFFNQLGIHIHEVGLNSFVIDALPQIFGNVEIDKVILDLMENMQNFQDDGAVKKQLELRMAISASHAAINKSKRLHVEEAQALINQLFACQSPFLCPQGKPTLACISSEELNKKFKSVFAN